MFEPIVAHVKWFVDSPGNPVNDLSPIEAAIIGVCLLAGVGILWLLSKWHWLPFVDKYSSKLWQHVPFIVRISTALTILLNATHSVFLAPNFDTDMWVTRLLSVGLLVTATLFLFGYYSRYAAYLLLAIYLTSVVVYNPFDVLDHLEMVGVGLYLITTGSGIWSVDAKYRKVKKPTDLQLSQAGRRLQIWAGAAIVSLAVTEKLFGVDLATAFLKIHDWNMLSGLGVSDRYFILTAGVIELIVGMSLILGWATRLTTLALLGLMIITASLLGVQEIYGHLFAVGVVATAWVVSPKSVPKGKAPFLARRKSAK